MVSVPGFISSRRQAILDAARRHGASSVRVFGSHARGDAEDGSDVDLLIEMESDCSLLEQVALWQELKALLGRDVDLIDAAALHWFIRDRVLREAIALKDPRLFLLHMRESIQRIEAYTRDGREAFLADQKTIDAVVRNFEIIGEAARRLPAAMKALAPGVSWKELSDFRNFLIHVYDAVDPSKVWGIIDRHLPSLKAAIDKLLGEVDPLPPLFKPQ